MKSNLERFQMTKLCPFQEKIQRQYLSANVSNKTTNVDTVADTSWHMYWIFLMFPQLTGHLEEMLQTAYNKFHIWQTRRMMRKTWVLMTYPKEDKEDIKVYGQMTCEGPDCCEETVEHSLMDHSPQGLNDEDIEGRCYIP